MLIQMGWMSCFFSRKLRFQGFIKFLIKFSECQLLINQVLILVILLTDSQIQRQTGTDIDSKYIRRKFLLGWIIISVFLLQQLFLTIVLIRYISKCVINYFSLSFCYNYTSSYVKNGILVPLIFALMNKYPKLFALTRKFPSMDPLKKKLA